MHGDEGVAEVVEKTLEKMKWEDHERANGTFVVAECGVNWRSIGEAKKLIEIFKECGANACKFQMYQEEHVALHPRAEELKSIIIGEDQAKELYEYGKVCGMEVFFTPMYPEAIDILKRVGVKRYKVRSKDAVNTELLLKVMETKKDVLVSVAGDRLDWDTLEAGKYRYKAKLLYCVQRYPAKDHEVHLKSAFPSLRSYISSVEYTGLSDHTPGITCPIAAVAMGALVIEKHVMIDRMYDWIDSPVSITPLEFKEMVNHIRRVEVLRQ